MTDPSLPPERDRGARRPRTRNGGTALDSLTANGSARETAGPPRKARQRDTGGHRRKATRRGARRDAERADRTTPLRRRRAPPGRAAETLLSGSAPGLLLSGSAPGLLLSGSAEEHIVPAGELVARLRAGGGQRLRLHVVLDRRALARAQDRQRRHLR